MSVPFVAHTHHVPASVLFQAIGVQSAGAARSAIGSPPRPRAEPPRSRADRPTATRHRRRRAAAGRPTAMNDQLLAAVSLYGAPALFGIVAIAAIGVPLPITLLLIVAGSMISQGAMNLWWAIGAAGAGSILGDQAGYAIGRWGGPAVVTKLSGLFGKRVNLRDHGSQSESLGRLRHLYYPLAAQSPGTLDQSGQRHGRLSVAPLPLWDILGEITGAAVFISLGWFFSDRVMSPIRSSGRPDLGDRGIARGHRFRISTADVPAPCAGSVTPASWATRVSAKPRSSIAP